MVVFRPTTVCLMPPHASCLGLQTTPPAWMSEQDNDIIARRRNPLVIIGEWWNTVCMMLGVAPMCGPVLTPAEHASRCLQDAVSLLVCSSWD